MEHLMYVLLQTADTATQAQPKSFFSSPMIMMILIIVVFYLFLIRPQMRRQKELKNFREGLKKGDKIVTTGGIYGKINNISDNVITVDVGNNLLIKIDKNAVLKDASGVGQPQK